MNIWIVIQNTNDFHIFILFCMINIFFLNLLVHFLSLSYFMNLHIKIFSLLLYKNFNFNFCFDSYSNPLIQSLLTNEMSGNLLG